MDVFPVEALQKVAYFLEEEELWKCRDVCRRWRECIDDTEGVDLWLGNPDVGIWRNYDGRPFKALSVIKDYGIQRCFMSCVESSDARPPYPNLNWKNPGTLLYLWIDGFIRPATLNQLTRDLIKLNTLEIHWTALDAGVNASEIQLDLPNLTLFSLQLFSTGDVTFKSLSTAFRNVMTLLGALTLPNLKSVNLSLPFEASYFQHLNRIILRFLIQNATKLKVVQMSYDFICTLQEECKEFTGIDVTLEDLSGVLDLEELRLICAPVGNISLDQIELLIQSQFHLTSIYSHLNHSDLKGTMSLTPINNNFRTLVSIQLVLYPWLTEDGDANPITLGLFARCEGLEVLELVCPGDVPKYPLLKHPALPKSLRVISFANFWIKANDAMRLVQKKPNLETFRLFNAGEDGDFGLPIHSLMKLINRKKVKRISLTKSVNLRSLPDGASPAMFERVRLELNSNGTDYKLDKLIDMDKPTYPRGDDEPESFGFHFHDFFEDEQTEVAGATSDDDDGDDGEQTAMDVENDDAEPNIVEVEDDEGGPAEDSGSGPIVEEPKDDDVGDGEDDQGQREEEGDTFQYPTDEDDEELQMFQAMAISSLEDYVGQQEENNR